jgi:hypothetical protein
MNEWMEEIWEAEKIWKVEEEARKRVEERKIQLDRMHHYQLECRTKCEQRLQNQRGMFIVVRYKLLYQS